MPDLERGQVFPDHSVSQAVNNEPTRFMSRYWKAARQSRKDVGLDFNVSVMNTLKTCATSDICR
jgi:hypothetical protein